MHRLVALLCVVAAFATVVTAIGKEEITVLVGRVSYNVHEQELTKLRKRVGEILAGAETLSQQICVQLLIPKASVELLGPIEMKTKDLLLSYLGAPQTDLDQLSKKDVTDAVERKLKEAVPTLQETLAEMENCAGNKPVTTKYHTQKGSESTSNE